MIQQRKKISLEAFDSLFYSFSNAFSLDKTLKGYDPIAVDGSDIYVDEMYGQYVKGAAEVTKAGLTSFNKIVIILNIRNITILLVLNTKREGT